MIILALDTCLGACSVAVLADGRVLAQISEAMTRGHQERLAPMVREAMAAAGLDFGALDRIAVTVGPGSFTGLRVGLAFTKGLEVALDRPCVGVGTLAALAASLETQSTVASTVAAVVDAGRGRLYLQMFADGAPLAEAESLEIGETLRRLEAVAARGPLTIVGPAGVVEAGPLAEAVAAIAAVRRVALEAPDPAAIAKLAADAAPAPPRPLYLRPPDATPPSPGGKGAGRPIVRRIRVREAEALAELHAAAFAGMDGQGPWPAQSLVALAAGTDVLALAAVVDGRPVAFVLARIAADEAEILTLATHPRRRRQGLARTLLEAAARGAAGRGARALFLEVAETNGAARALYAGTGFAPAGRRPAYYRTEVGAGEAVDALILRRDLTDGEVAVPYGHGSR